jgi:hypothetical protein
MSEDIIRKINRYTLLFFSRGTYVLLLLAIITVTLHFINKKRNPPTTTKPEITTTKPEITTTKPEITNTSNTKLSKARKVMIYITIIFFGIIMGVVIINLFIQLIYYNKISIRRF